MFGAAIARHSGAMSASKPRNLWRKVLIAIATLLAATIAFAAWYKMHYSMAVATALQVNGAADAPKVLIATQGSDFKDAVTAGLVEHLKQRAFNIRVIDVGDLHTIKPADWNVIVLMHTWEISRPPSEVESFVEGLPSRDRLLVVSTSGQGDLKMDGVDVVTSASVMADVPRIVKDLAGKVDKVLATPPP